MDSLHGQQVPDPYRWLEDVSSPEVQAWMEAQDQAARDYLSALPGRARIADRLRELFYVDSVSAPRKRGSRYFYTRRHADREKAVVYWRDGDAEAGEERALLDPNTMSEDGSTSLGVWVPTLDGSRVAYSLRENNADEATLYLLEVATGAVSATDVIPGARYATPQWVPDGSGYYYAYLPTDPDIPVDIRPGLTEIRYHALGTDPAADPVIHPALGDPQVFLRTAISRDGRWLFIYRQRGWNRTEITFRDLHATDPDVLGAWTPLAVGRDHSYSVIAWQDRFYIWADEEPRGCVYRADPLRPERDQWDPLVPERADATLDNFQIIGGHLVLTYLRNAASELEIRTLEGEPVRAVPLPGIGTCGGMTGNPEEDEAYFTYTSFDRPAEVYRTRISTGETDLWARVDVPIDPEPYQVEQVWYPSRDGTRISMFLVRRKDIPRDGSTPFLLYGYGGFNVSLTPSFAGSLYAWLERGGGYALPNLRGGGEYGEEWHRAGMQANKQNVFDDFLAAAEYLIAEGYTRPERLAIRGGSNGGLLVGAAMTQRPDLFRAVSCGVPLLDMLRYHLFGSGRTWIPEYGDPDVAEEFCTLAAYSPYHHVKKGTRYPALLMQSADHDDRVDPMHARKFVALVQSATMGEHPVLLRIEKHAGHGGADLVRAAVEQGADLYAFLCHELGANAQPVE